jgi:hypothetical protein
MIAWMAWGVGVVGVTLALVTPWITRHRYLRERLSHANAKQVWMLNTLALECVAALAIAASISSLATAEPVRLTADVIGLIAALTSLYVLFAAGRAAS